MLYPEAAALPATKRRACILDDPKDPSEPFNKTEILAVFSTPEFPKGFLDRKQPAARHKRLRRRDSDIDRALIRVVPIRDGHGRKVCG